MQSLLRGPYGTDARTGHLGMDSLPTFHPLETELHTATKTAPMPPKLPASGITAAAAKTLNASGRSDEEVPEQNARLKRHR